MSDALRTVLSVGRSALGRIGLVGLRSRSRQDEVRVGGLRGRLFRKYVLLLIGLVGIVLLVNAGLQSWFSYEENKASLFRIQQEKARSAAHRIEGFVDDIEHQLGWTAAPQWAASPLEQRRFDLVRLLHQAPAITELIQLDDHGKEQLKVSRLAMDVVGSGKNYSQSPDFIEAQKHRVWFSPVYFRKESEPYMTVAMAEAERNAGVTIAEVNLKLIWDVIAGLKLGEHGYAYVIDRDGRLIAHPDISLVLRNTDLANLPQVAAARAEAQADQFAPPVIVAKNINGGAVLTAHAAVVPLGWTVFVENPLSDALAPLYGAAWRMAALFALALVLATLAALLLARRMVVPIRLLQAGATRIGAGELDRRIEIHTGDELEELAGGFNRMAGDLQKSYADLENKVENRTAELKEALEQQTATAEVLGVINSSPGDLTPVFDSILEKAHALCGAAYGGLVTYDGEAFRVVAAHGEPRFIEYWKQGPIRPPEGTPLARVMHGEAIAHIIDAPAEDSYRNAPAYARLIDLGGVRTFLIVPLRKDDVLLGVITAYRQEVRPFTDKQIALLQNFAAQAVIAMENARLLTETREALEQQTATAEVLQVINSSPGDLAPVFDAMLDRAMRLCEAAFGVLWAYEGNRYRAAAVHGAPAAFVEFLRQPLLPHYDPGSGLERALRGENLVITNDMAAEEIYRHGDPLRRAIVDLGGARSHILVALRKDETLLGAISIYRQEVRPFSDKQIALLQNFAAQAVIAMENARLITETREALEQQTATAEVLGVINSWPGVLTPVFDAMLKNALTLCDASFGQLVTFDGISFRAAAWRGYEPGPNATTPTPGMALYELVHGEPVVHIPDITADDVYRSGNAVRRRLADHYGARTAIWVALKKDSALLGAFVIYRTEARPFTNKQIALLQNFAAQAVIAIENARLITETREALEQQTATAEVLQVINSSPGDLAPVFDAMLEKATRLCEAAHGQLATFDGKFFRFVAVHGDAGFVEGQQALGLLEPSYGVTWPRIVAGEHCVHIPDVRDTELFRAGHESARRFADVGRGRSLLTVALRKDQALLGALTVYRQEMRPFTEKEIALLQNFAAQAVIAMENARLITETREALEQQTATAEVLQVINSSPGDLAPVFDAMLEKAMHLCEAAFGTLWTYDGACVHAAALHNVPPVFAEFLTRAPHQVGPDSAHGRLVRGEPVVHIPDIVAEKAYRLGDPIRRALVELGGGRTLLAVPLRKDNTFLGDFVIYRQEARPFSDKQIALLQNFAAQAVIAMENARLITETREALEQQTATAEVLQVINSSPGDLAPVFQSIVEKAHTLCGAVCGSLQLWDGEKFHGVAMRGFSEPMTEGLRQGYIPGPKHPCRRLLEGERIAHCADLAEIDDPVTREGGVALGGIGTILFVALRKDAVLLGQIVAARQEVRPFTEKEIALVENFAAQAVIAMENARLLTETREALEQQTATAEVLQVINSSPGDLAPIFDAMLEKALRLCEAGLGTFYSFDGEEFHSVANRGAPTELEGTLRGHFARIVDGETLVHIADLADTEMYRSGLSRCVTLVDIGGARTTIWLALRRDETLVGVLVIYRQEVRPFSDKQIALLQNFAAQAVIAMENARLITETREALEQQTATAEVLQVINSSPGDLAPVFETILDKAHTLCGATLGSLFLFDGELFRAAATHGYPEDLAQRLRQGVVLSATTQLLDDSVRWVHNPDLTLVDTPTARAVSGRGGVRTNLMLPLRKDGRLLGAISCNRQEIRPFADKEIALLQNFAAQAVIAMENARLLTETREALEQQTATAEVLQVINSSPGDLAPVFNVILEKAHTLCGAAHGSLQLYDGENLHAVATHGVSDKFAEILRQGYRAAESPASGALIEGKRFAHIADCAEIDHPVFRSAAELAGIHTVLFVPLRRDNEFLGLISAARLEVRRFSEKEIALLQNFAAQAVIAMENARLLTETREALEQQTATAEVLQVINSSPGVLTPVFDAMLKNALTLCDASFGQLVTFDGVSFRAAAWRGYEPGPNATTPTPGMALYELVHGEQVVHIPDITADDVYRSGNAVRRRLADQYGARTAIWVALKKDSALLGAFVIYRTEARPFTNKQIALLQNFAAQAVIAIENARLITETREALEQQTATAEVLQVINSSPGDLAPVFDAMLEKALALCGAAFGGLWTFDGERFPIAAVRGVPPALTEYFREPLPALGVLADIVRGAAIVQIADIAEDKAYSSGPPARRALADLGGARTTVWMVLRKEEKLLGLISICRQEVRPFSEKEIALLQNFAAQAVIAMENARLITETRVALEQQTATAEVLQVINSSPGDLAPVFEAMLEKATHLCEASFGVLCTYDGASFRATALRGVPAAYARFLTAGPLQPGPGNGLARVAAGEKVVHVLDVAAEDTYRSGEALRRALVDLGGARTTLTVALPKDNALLGAFIIYRREVRPFTEKQIALVQNFAAQAVIAMENVRLITELRESLEYQTATGEVLRVVSRSAFDLDTVLHTVVATAIRLCRADSAVIYRNDDGEYRWAAGHMLSPEYEEIERNVRIQPGTGTVVGRAALEGATVQILDAWTDPLYEAKDDARVGGVHTMIGVPLLREGAPIGVIGLARRRVEAFSEREIQLVTTFADQAVIAIENARLITELRQRTHDLQESLEYQTATSDVLKVISRSGAELGPVLDTLVETAARICRADSGFIFRAHDGLCRMVASFGIPAEYKDFQTRNPIAPGRGTLAGRTVLERRAVHIEDAAADPEYTRVQAVQLGRQRTMLGVPLIREDTLIGVITLARAYVEPFSEKQIGLVTTFADQAVIAIENARLFNELRERTTELGRSVEELKMLGEVGRAVSSTLDLRSVLSTVLTASLGVTWANAGAIFRYIRAERAFRLVEAVGWDEALARSVRDLRVVETETAMGEAVTRQMPIQLADLAERPSAPLRDAALAGGFHSALIVPLVGAERILGAITLMRQEAGEFPAETVRLMQTLASQSVLAIQNARLFREIADKSEQLALASQHKSQFLANMSHELRTPLNAILGYAELLVDGIYGALPERPKGVIERIQNNGKHLLALINDVLDLAKIEAGQLTLTLEDYSLPEVVTSVVTATEPLATSKGLKFTTAVQDGMPMAHGDARRVSQVLLNLVGNAIKFTDEGEIEIRAAAERGQFVLTVRDTGPGIPDADQERIFGEFQQIDNSNTRKQGGTGLGLAISKRMVEMQGGMISVDSVVGKGSTFRVLLPIHVDEVLEEAA